MKNLQQIKLQLLSEEWKFTPYCTTHEVAKKHLRTFALNIACCDQPTLQIEYDYEPGKKSPYDAKGFITGNVYTSNTGYVCPKLFFCPLELKDVDDSAISSVVAVCSYGTVTIGDLLQVFSCMHLCTKEHPDSIIGRVHKMRKELTTK